jgi:hypothetical protein
VESEQQAGTPSGPFEPVPHVWDTPYPLAIIEFPEDLEENRPLADAAWDTLFRRYSRYRPSDEEHRLIPPTIAGEGSPDLGTDRAWARCLHIARDNGARMAVIETRYYDADYRSELSAFYSKTFAHHEDTTHRIHFFGALIRPPVWKNLDSETYLGYVNIRPQVAGLVGRTMLLPPEPIRAAVRTAVKETVHVFGRKLEIRAVPFTQQDARLGSCAHAVAWMCHYSAFLGERGVRRRLMADFSLAVHSELAPGRPLPTMGLTLEQLCGVLTEFHLPALHYELATMLNSDRPAEWGARDESPDASAKRTCCRYLNSGLPLIAIILCQRGTEAPYARHALLVCGYTRPDDDSASVSLIVNDDRRGPYLLVDHLFADRDDAAQESYRWEHVLAPMPEKVWVSGEVAERFGALRMMEAAEKAIALKSHEGARRFRDEVNQGSLTLRTYATTANRFKERLLERMSDSVVLGHYMEARLPRHIWVVEAIDRGLREAGHKEGGTRGRSVKCVVGEIILDATSFEGWPTVLAIRLPGLLSMAMPWDPLWDTACSEEVIATGGQYYP